MSRIAVSVLLVAASAGVQAQSAEPVTPPLPEASAVAAPVDDCRCVKAGTVVELEIVDPINSSQRKRGDAFALRVATPVLVDGNEAIAAGTAGTGEIVHAEPARSGGKPGELLLAGRYLDVGGERWPLRGLKLGTSGKDNSTIAMWFSLAAGPFALFVRGREIEIPPGTRVHARLASDMPLSPPAAAPSTVAIAAADPPAVALASLMAAPLAPERAALPGASNTPPGAAMQPTTPVPAASPIPAPPADRGQVVFFRAKELLGGMKFKVREAGEVVGTVRDGGYFVATLAPGLHEFEVHSETRDILPMEIEAGETYYVLGSLTLGAIIDRPNLSPSEESAFLALAGELKKTE